MKKIFVVLIALSLALSLYAQGAQEVAMEQNTNPFNLIIIRKQVI